MGSVRCAPSWVAGAASVGAARRALSFVAVARGGFEARGTLCETICVLRVKMTRVFCRRLHRYSIMPSTTLQRNRAMPMSRLLCAVNSPCQSSLGVRVNSHPRHTDAWRRVETPPERSRPLRPGFQALELLVRVFTAATFERPKARLSLPHRWCGGAGSIPRHCSKVHSKFHDR